jgi:hypothetical protein
MTTHIELSAVIKDGDRTSKRVRHADIVSCGGLTHLTTDARAAAVKLSKLPWCDRVVATIVAETPMGTWRKGRKS